MAQIQFRPRNRLADAPDSCAQLAQKKKTGHVRALRYSRAMASGGTAMNLSSLTRDTLWPWVTSTWGKVLSTVAVTSLVGALTSIPIFWIVVGAAVVGACIMGALAANEYIQRAYQRPPNYEQWAGHDSYSMWVAACLWADQEPYRSIYPGTRAYPSLQRLKAAARAGHLKTVTGDETMNAEVTRSALLDYASSRTVRPHFLA